MSRSPAPNDTRTTAGRKRSLITRSVRGAVVLVTHGPDQGQALTVSDRPAIIGGDQGCDLVLSDPAVSRRHLEARWNGRALEVRDLDSKNGSYFGNRRFYSMEIAVGDQVQVGCSALTFRPAAEELDLEETEGGQFGGLVGRSPAMRKLFTLIHRIAPSDLPTLVEGETGVGKELVAEEIHRRSPRRRGPFLLFDCGAVPQNLIEASLFGHLRGAYTGAVADSEGVFAAADGGTVFLDEIGELDLSLQPALLRAIDRGMILPVGESRYSKVDVRVIAATNRNLSELVDEGRFREDLYFRLAGVHVAVPPLRERPEDIEALVHHFLVELGRPDLMPGEEALAELAAYEWPGNARELRNGVERAIALARGGPLDAEAILGPREQRPAPVEPDDGEAPPPQRTFREAKAEAVEAFERAYLKDLVADHDSLSAAAQAASMDRKHLRGLLKRYRIRSPTRRG